MNNIIFALVCTAIYKGDNLCSTKSCIPGCEKQIGNIVLNYTCQAVGQQDVCTCRYACQSKFNRGSQRPGVNFGEKL